MKSMIDAQKLKRRTQTAQILSFGGMILLLVGVVLLFQKPDLGFDTEALANPLLLGGFIIANGGIYLANRWLKRPRPEDVLDYGLKPLPNTSRLYHYLLPADHVLLTPSGVVVIEVVALEGKFAYRAGRWRQKFNLSRSLRLLVEERLGDPIQRANARAQQIRALIAGSLDEPLPPIEPMVVFTHPQAVLDVDDAPIPVTGGHKLNKRLPLPVEKLPTEIYDELREILDWEAGLDEGEDNA